MVDVISILLLRKTDVWYSKYLMFDCDGDKSLVVRDKQLIRLAKRNMQGIVPLYYNMHKAEPSELNNDTLFHGLELAYTGGNIGIISNKR